MAIFGRKEKEVAKKAEATEVPATSTAPVGSTNLHNTTQSASRASLIIRPYVTEKAAVATDDGVYTFVVAEKATKIDIKSAIKELYKKTPRKVTIAKKPSKLVMRRNGTGTKKGLKKAYVYLKKGETIDII